MTGQRYLPRRELPLGQLPLGQLPLRTTPLGTRYQDNYPLEPTPSQLSQLPSYFPHYYHTSPMVLGHNPPEMYPSDTYPKEIYTWDTYPLDT